jgi:hypothetical protein
LFPQKHANIEVEPTLLAALPARQLVDGTYQSAPLRIQRPSLEAPLQVTNQLFFFFFSFFFLSLLA